MATQPTIDNYNPAALVMTNPREQARKQRAAALAHLIKPDAPAHSLAEYHIPGAEFDPTQLVLEPGLPETEWLRIGKALMHINQASHFWLGDWVEYGRRLYGIVTAIDLAVQATGLCRVSIKKMAWVARSFEPHRRKRGLSFTHHVQLANFPKQLCDKLLNEAEEQGLSARQARELAEEEHGKGNRNYKQKQVKVFLYPETIERIEQLTAKAGNHRIDWFIVRIIEDWLRWRGEGDCIPTNIINKMTSKERRALWKDQGLCYMCGTNPPAIGFNSCQPCRETAKKWNREHGRVTGPPRHRTKGNTRRKGSDERTVVAEPTN